MKKDIQIARIDERLIHGQVVTAWIKIYPVEKILIIDDELSKNKLMMRIYKAAAPAGIEIQVLQTNEAIDYLLNDDKTEKLMLLAKTPNVFEELIDKGVPIDEIILGGMGAKEGRVTLNRNIAVNDLEKQSLDNMLNNGIRIIYQMVPDDRKINVQNWLERM